MYRRLLIVKLLLFGAFLIPVSGIVRAASLVPQKKSCPEPPKSPFRYAIVYNDETDYRSSEGDAGKFRVVEVLLDSTAFSEGTLRQLFALLSKRFPKSDRLFVHVHTNLEDVHTPEEAEQIPPLSSCDVLPGGKYPWAMYNRSGGYEGFNYSMNRLGESVRVVTLRGKVQ
jgi:hypothetical protein